MSASPDSRRHGLGRVLVVIYGVLALAATGRSVSQIISRFEEAPLAYSLSAIAAVVYAVATVALVMPGEVWRRVAWATINFEMLGVLVVGALTVANPGLFPSDTVWSDFGRGYVFIPLVLPVLGLVWLYHTRPRTPKPGGSASAEPKAELLAKPDEAP